METRSRLPAHAALKAAWPHLFFGVLLTSTFLLARQVTGDLEWPCEEDFWRDMGFARTILEGRYGEDPFYLGEKVWYPPLVHALLALITKVSGAALNVVSVRSGAYLDLLAPIAFYLLALRWAGPVAALFAGIAFLLLGPHNLCSCDGEATYSPWLWPDNFAQGLGYLALFVALAWRKQPTIKRAAITGFVLGVSALAHSAPAVMAAGLITLLTAHDALVLLRSGQRREAGVQFGQLGLVAVISMLTTLPFTAHVLSAYGGAGIKNWEGVGWQHEHHHLSALLLLLEDQVSFRGGFALVGLGFLFTRHAPSRSKWLAPAFGLLAAAGIAWGYLHEWALSRGHNLPILFSSWHFALYLQAAESLLAGLGLASLSSVVVAKRSEWRAQTSVLVATVLAVFGLSQYAGRADLVRNRAHALWRARREHPELMRWIMENSASDDVFLASPREAMFSVAPAARKVLVLPRDFANPYVNPEPREALQKRLLEAPAEEFRALAKKNGIRFVILEPDGLLGEAGRLRTYIERPPWFRQRHTAARNGPDRAEFEFRPGGHEDCPWALTTCEPPGGRVRIFEILDDPPPPTKPSSLPPETKVEGKHE